MAGAASWIGLLAEVRVGDVALDALDRQHAGQRAATAVLDHVAERVDRGRFADDAEIEHLAARLQRFDDDRRCRRWRRLPRRR
jgi:hypothetical protein